MSAFDLFLNFLEGLLSNVALDPPGGEGVSLRKHIFDLLKSPTSSFRETEKHVDERGKVEGPENEVSLPRDMGETRGNGPCQCEIEHPGSGVQTQRR